MAATFSSASSLAAPALLASPLCWQQLLDIQPSPSFAAMADIVAMGSEAPTAKPVPQGSRQLRASKKAAASSGVPPAEGASDVLPRVLAAVAEALGSSIEAGQSLMEAGLDSLGEPPELPGNQIGYTCGCRLRKQARPTGGTCLIWQGA